MRKLLLDRSGFSLLETMMGVALGSLGVLMIVDLQTNSARLMNSVGVDSTLVSLTGMISNITRTQKTCTEALRGTTPPVMEIGQELAIMNPIDHSPVAVRGLSGAGFKIESLRVIGTTPASPGKVLVQAQMDIQKNFSVGVRNRSYTFSLLADITPDNHLVSCESFGTGVSSQGGSVDMAAICDASDTKAFDPTTGQCVLSPTKLAHATKIYECTSLSRLGVNAYSVKEDTKEEICNFESPLPNSPPVQVSLNSPTWREDILARKIEQASYTDPVASGAAQIAREKIRCMEAKGVVSNSSGTETDCIFAPRNGFSGARLAMGMHDGGRGFEAGIIKMSAFSEDSTIATARLVSHGARLCQSMGYLFDGNESCVIPGDPNGTMIDLFNGFAQNAILDWYLDHHLDQRINGLAKESCLDYQGVLSLPGSGFCEIHRMDGSVIGTVNLINNPRYLAQIQALAFQPGSQFKGNPQPATFLGAPSIGVALTGPSQLAN